MVISQECHLLAGVVTCESSLSHWPDSGVLNRVLSGLIFIGSAASESLSLSCVYSSRSKTDFLTQ